jgi:hypothetical protein
MTYLSIGISDHNLSYWLGSQFFSTLPQSQQPLIAGAVAAVLGIVGFAVSSGNKSDESGAVAAAKVSSSSTQASVEKVDISIPYNAAAMLEYTKLMGSKFDADTFKKFEAIYNEKVVAQVTAKKVARDSELEAARLEAIVAKADAELAALTSK